MSAPLLAVEMTVVRDAAPSDAEGIADVARRSVPQTYEGLIGDPGVVRSIVDQSYAHDVLRKSIARCASADDAHFLVATEDGRTVGFLHYDCEGAEPELHRIYIDPSRKRQGIGSALMRELHARLPERSTYILMAVVANDGAVSFYRHHGLEEVERIDGVEFMHDHMGVEFPPGTARVPALIMRFTKQEGGSS